MRRKRGAGQGARAEQRVIDYLRQQLEPADSMLTCLRLSDPRHGDVEADVVLFLAGCGIAVVEVKSGQVAYRDGQWLVTGTGYSRRTNPVEQARRAKHALRRFLDRQPEWTHGLLHAEWFVVLPETTVAADLGPEGSRERLIGAGELGGAVERMRHVLRNGPGPVAPLPPDWSDDALTLLMRRGGEPTAPSGSRLRRGGLVAFITALFLVAAGAIALSIHATGETANRTCNANYEPCIPVASDLDCPDIGFAVRVIGADEYALDRDGDGKACETLG